MERSYVHKNGHIIWCELRISLISAADGKPLHFHCQVQDITERKLQQETLRKSEGFLHRTGRLAGVGGWEVDFATRQSFWSDEARRILGVPPDYEPGFGGVDEFVAPEMRAKLVATSGPTLPAARGGKWNYR